MNTNVLFTLQTKWRLQHKRHFVYRIFQSFKVLQKFKELLEHWLIPQLQQEMNNFIFQQDVAPPHWHRDVRAFLNHILPLRWIGRIGKDDLVLNTWRPRSPDLTPHSGPRGGNRQNIKFHQMLPKYLSTITFEFLI